MALADITDPESVLKAMAEYDQLGEAEFCERYGFRPSRKFWVLHGGKRYASKAILGADHGFQFRDHGPLSYEDFSGGTTTIERLEALGFEVVELPTGRRVRSAG